MKMLRTQTPLYLTNWKRAPADFVTEMKRSAEKKQSAKDLLRQLERSYSDRIGHWKHGGIVGCERLRRWRDRPPTLTAEEFPGVANFILCE